MAAVGFIGSLDDPADGVTVYLLSIDGSDRLLRQAMTRRAVAAYLGVEGSAVELAKDAHGRVYVAAPAAGLEMSVSHTRGVLAVALTSEGRIGVDVEVVHSDTAMEPVAKTHFTADEQRRIGALGGGERVTAFFRLWTAKEALAKAIGYGVSLEFDQIEIGEEESSAARVLRVAGSAEVARGWEIHFREMSVGESAIVVAVACTA